MSDAKPEYSSLALQFAADPAYAPQGDDRDGKPTKVQPPLGVIRQGTRAMRQLPAPAHNWVLNELAGVSKALIEHVGEVEAQVRLTGALNWPYPPATIEDALAVRLAYNDLGGDWVIVSPSDFALAYGSADGLSWSPLSITAPATKFYDVAFHGGSHCIVAVDTSGEPEGVLVAHVDGGSAVMVPGSGPLGYSTGSHRITSHSSGWCIAALQVAEESLRLRLFTSANGAAWTELSSPHEDADIDSVELLCRQDDSRLVVIYRTTGGDWYVASSDNLGNTWTTQGPFDLGSGNWTAAISQESGRIIIARDISGVGSVLHVTDDFGQTFSDIEIDGHRIFAVAFNKDVVVGAGPAAKVNWHGRLVYSPDRGDTWLDGGHTFVQVPSAAAFGGGTFVCAGQEKAWVSMRVPPAGPVLT